MDLGECPQIHSNKLKDEYEKAVASGKDLGYEWEWERALERFVSECDRKVVANRRRIEKQPENPVAVQLMREIQDLEQEMATLMAAVEQLGEEGKVSESMEALKNVEGVKARKADLEVKLKTATGGDIGQHQKLKVCETCSAYLSMHLGYKEIRDKLEELKSKSRDRLPSAPSGCPDHHDSDSRSYGSRGGGYGDRHGDRYGAGGRGVYSGGGRGAGYRGYDRGTGPVMTGTFLGATAVKGKWSYVLRGCGNGLPEAGVWVLRLR
ncbi:MAG: hypothetical protein BJ554DRAFT_4101 [Olpidium bornovanus]|uniref:Uncharacterized protein n=1 Tax=Olpidium bornovanus TaxID=278681 RepID=A0A8H8DFC2_9FUNG|nr:MAG: hypothetical protein BJ554DRAFT_4101 [Olpidium bornovanus]